MITEIPGWSVFEGYRAVIIAMCVAYIPLHYFDKILTKFKFSHVGFGPNLFLLMIKTLNRMTKEILKPMFNTCCWNYIYIYIFFFA